MLSFILFSLIPSSLLSSILLICQIIFFIIFFSIYIFTYWMVQLLFIIIQHWVSLRLHQFISSNVIYNNKVNFEKRPCKPTSIKCITRTINLFTSITDNCPGTGNYFYWLWKLRSKNLPTNYRNPSNQLILCSIICISMNISKCFVNVCLKKCLILIILWGIVIQL